MRREILELLHEIDELDAAARASWTRIAACALLSQLPAQDRETSMDFLNKQHRARMQ
jgi:hypothetical protein